MSIPSSAISYVDAKPVWNLDAITAFPIELKQQSGKNTPVYVYLSPYTASELKAVLKQTISGYKRDKKDVEMVSGDNSIYSSIFDNHFIKLGNATGTPDAQRAWINKYSELKPSIVEHTYGGLRRDPVEDAAEDTMLDISAELSSKSDVYQTLYDETTSAVVRVDMSHNYTHPTEAQYRKFKNARRSKFVGKGSIWTISESHGTLEELYDAVVTSVDGVAVNGEPCTAKTKDVWISYIPLWHKLWIVDQIFGELVEKNG